MRSSANIGETHMKRLNNLMAELFRISESDIGENTSLKNTPAWDSLRHMELVVGIETMYGIQLEVDEIVAMISYPAIVEVLRNKGVE